MTVADTSCLGEGQCWPPGFRFHPTDEELVLYYLKRKICRRRLKLDIIGETDVYKWDPEELPGQSKLITGDRQWFFFSPRDRKYPNGARSNRATRQGYWKATGKDRAITCNSRTVGVKKTLVFYKGRAHTGERTDWVMHEYTLDEEELKRCQTAEDYYALYKVYKKSGPGPKNGEQYGAPFREEDWADDENAVNKECVDQDVVCKVNNITSLDDNDVNGEILFPINDLEELMNGVADNPVLVQPLAVDNTYALQDVIDEEETESTLMDQPSRDANLHEQNIVLHPSRDQNDMQARFVLTQSTTSQLQLCDTSEVTSAANIHIQETHAPEEDFLEIDDLTGPVFTVLDAGKSVGNLQFQQMDVLSELDLCQDLTMFLQDMGHMAHGSVSHSYFNEANNEVVASVSRSGLINLENGAVYPVSHPYSNNLETELDGPVSDSHFYNLDDRIVDPSDLSFDYQLQTQTDDASLISDQLWIHDKKLNDATPAESNLGATISGVVYDGSSANLPKIADQNGSSDEDFGGDSWSSGLWAFVESIPTAPASAVESTFVNKAFQRMSSFGRMGPRVRTSAGSRSASADKPTASMRSSRSRCNRGFIFFSVLGVACAALWVLIGTSVRVLDRYIFS